MSEYKPVKIELSPKQRDLVESVLKTAIDRCSNYGYFATDYFDYDVAKRALEKIKNARRSNK